MQIKIVGKEEAHKIIDEIPKGNIMIISYDSSIGISKTNKRIRKKKCRKEVNKAETVVMLESKPVSQLDLYNIKINNVIDLEINKFGLVKSVIMVKG